MKSRTLALVAALALSTFSYATLTQQVAAQEASLKIAVVDMDAVIAQSAAGQALSQKLQEFQEQTQEQVTAQQEHLKDLQQKVSESVNSTDQAQLLNLQKSFEQSRQQLLRFREDKAREAQQIRAEGLGEIEKQFEPVFNAIQDEFSYDLILNKQSGVVLMVGDRVNITQMVIDRLR